MKTVYWLAAALPLMLAACDTGVTPDVQTGGAAGAEGPGYCDSPPADPDQLDHWNELCMPGGNR